MPISSSVMTNGPEPTISVDDPAPKSSSLRSSVAGESSPELIVEVACRKPGAGAEKWKVTVSASTTSLEA